MYLKPCRFCVLKNSCRVRIHVTASISQLKLGITSVRFSCKWYFRTFAPGDVVILNLRNAVTGETSYNEYESQPIFGEIAAKGTVMRWSRNFKLLICLDDEFAENVNHMVIKVLPVNSGVTKVKDEKRTLCPECNLPEGAYLPDWGCPCQDKFHLRKE